MMLRVASRAAAVGGRVSAPAVTALVSAARAAAASKSRSGVLGNATLPTAAKPLAAYTPLPEFALQNLPDVDRAWLAIDGPSRIRLEALIDKSKSFSTSSALHAREKAREATATEPTPCAKLGDVLEAAVAAFVGAGAPPAARTEEERQGGMYPGESGRSVESRPSPTAGGRRVQGLR